MNVHQPHEHHGHEGHGGHSHHGHPAPAASSSANIDPICGMTVAPDSPRRFAYEGTTYYFCSDHCLKKFSADPAKERRP